MPDDSTRTISVELPTELVDAITAAAHERVVGRNLLICKMLEEALDALVPPSVTYLRPHGAPDE